VAQSLIVNARSWAVSLLLAAAPASAHHSSALFDTAKQVTLDGVITKYDWRNPHVYMAIRVTGADGGAVDQQIEAGASSVLLPLGLTPDAVAIGERVTVRGNPSRSGPGHMVLGRELVKADGSVLPLNINSAASRVAPLNVTAASIAGTWFPPRENFFAFNGTRRSWSLTDLGQQASAAFSGRETAHPLLAATVSHEGEPRQTVLPA